MRVSNGICTRDYTVAGCRITAILYPHKIALLRTSYRYAAYGIEPSIPVYDQRGAPILPTDFGRVPFHRMDLIIYPRSLRAIAIFGFHLP